MPDGSAVSKVNTVVCFSFEQDDLINQVIATVTGAGNPGHLFVMPVQAGCNFGAGLRMGVHGITGRYCLLGC